MKNSHPIEYEHYKKYKTEPVNSAPEKSRKRYQLGFDISLYWSAKLFYHDTWKISAWKCPECDASFISENTLKLHMRNGHALEDIETFNNR